MMLLLIILLVYLFLDHRGGINHSSKVENQVRRNENQTLAILNERYAAGEIDDEEYKRKKTILKN